MNAQVISNISQEQRQRVRQFCNMLENDILERLEQNPTPVRSFDLAHIREKREDADVLEARILGENNRVLREYFDTISVRGLHYVFFSSGETCLDQITSYSRFMV